MNNAIRTLSTYLLPASASGRTLAAGSFVDAFGSGLFLAVSTLYFVGTVGISPSAIALTLAVAGSLGLLTGAPSGRLADRLGVRRVYLCLLALRGLAYGLFVLVHGFTGYFLVTCVATVLDRGCSPLNQAAVRLVVGAKDRNRTMSSIRALRNVGYTAGTLVAASAVAVHSRGLIQLLFAVNALTFLVTAWCSRRALTMIQLFGGAAEAARGSGPGPAGPASAAESSCASARVPSPFRVPTFMALTLGNGLMCLHDTILVVLLPVWVLHHHAIPLGIVPVLLSVNTALTVALQIWISSLVLGRTTVLGLLWGAVAALCTACALFALAGLTPALLAMAAVGLAVALLTVGENFHAAASWYLSDALAPPDAYARYIGAFTTGVTAHGLLGPALVLGVLFPLGTAGWAVLGALFAAGAGGMTLGATRLKPALPTAAPVAAAMTTT
jgi:hypothetical protein